jgi:hypothetical protein
MLSNILGRLFRANAKDPPTINVFDADVSIAHRELRGYPRHLLSSAAFQSALGVCVDH